MTEQPAVTIRRRADDDLAATADVLLAVHEHDGYPVEGVADPIAWLVSPQLLTAWVAELDNHIVGHVSISRPQPDDAAAHAWAENSAGDAATVAVLGRLFVSPTARGHALGARLLATAAEYASAEGLRLVLDVMAKDATAIALYERLGWTRIGTAEHDNGHGATFPAYLYVSPAPAAHQ
jgi:GNAT superfamily N-acetyltransferase